MSHNLNNAQTRTRNEKESSVGYEVTPETALLHPNRIDAKVGKRREETRPRAAHRIAVTGRGSRGRLASSSDTHTRATFEENGDTQLTLRTASEPAAPPLGLRTQLLPHAARAGMLTDARRGQCAAAPGRLGAAAGADWGARCSL